MEYRYEFGDGPFHVVVTTSGEAALDELVAGRRRVLADPRFRPEMNILVDHSLLDVSGLSAEDIREAATSASSDQLTFGQGGYVAIVTASPLQFGLGRMYRSLASERLEQRVTVVASVEEAIAWLEESTTGSSPHDAA